MRSKTTQAQSVLRTRIRSRDLHDTLRLALLRSHPSACQVVCNKANYLSIKINASKLEFYATNITQYVAIKSCNLYNATYNI